MVGRSLMLLENLFEWCNGSGCHFGLKMGKWCLKLKKMGEKVFEIEDEDDGQNEFLFC